MIVDLQLKNISRSIRYEDAESTYTKDGLYCVQVAGGQAVHKYPIGDIFRSVEEYGPHLSNATEPETIPGGLRYGKDTK